MEYFMIENGQQAGPYTIAQLAEKHITSETLVWAEGMANWTPAWQVSELKYILGENFATTTPPLVPPVEPPVAQKPVTPNPELPHQQVPKSSKMIWKLLLAVVVAILLVLTITNPGEDAHKKKVQLEATEVVDKAMATTDNNFFTQGIRSIAKMMAGNFLDATIDQFFEYHNYILFSKGTVSYQGQEHAVSFGILGKVYTMNSDDILNALEKNDNIDIEESQESTTSPVMGSTPNSSNADNVDSQSPDNDDNDNANESQSLEDKANQAVDKMKDKVKKKVEDKINQKIDEVTDSSTIEKVIDKILDLF